MTTKLVVRVLDAGGDLLASSVHQARIRGDGCLRAGGPVVTGVARTGWPSVLSLHWCDLHVEVRLPAPAVAVQAGQIVTWFEDDAILIRVGDMPGPLPPITVGESVAVAVPVGGMGARP